VKTPKAKDFGSPFEVPLSNKAQQLHGQRPAVQDGTLLLIQHLYQRPDDQSAGELGREPF